MKFTVSFTVEAETFDEAVEALRDQVAGDAPAPKAKAKPKADEPAPKPKPKAAPADDGELDYETDVRPHVVGLSKDYGREVALEVLSKFTNPVDDEPCTKGQEVDPADWAKLLKRIKAKRAELED